MKTKKGMLGLSLVLLIIILLSVTFTPSTKAQSSGKIVGLWHMDGLVSVDYRELAPDVTGNNPGTLVHAPKSPELIDGKFGKALHFDGANGVYVPIRFIVGFPPSPQPIYIPISTSLDIQEELRVEAWINVQGFKDVPYGNIVVKCSRTDSSSENTTRVFGLAIKSGLPQNGRTVPVGGLSGCVFTDTAGFNEIVTTQPVVPLNEWIHVAFTRSLTTGMHLYLNGIEQQVTSLYGVQNPSGKIINGTEVYFGHDAEVTIDEIQITDLAPELETAMAEIDIGPNMLVALIAVTTIMAIALILRRVIQMWAIRGRP